ncbi:hypothetical protein [Paraherbaspirillum soli]|uniref:Type IV secretion protein Rhs n=1 Tax=Paraherbaspirillum soli TaxID=631222 RepID=A0ABW0M9I7_9BURK
MAQKVFKHAIDYAQVKVHKRPYIVGAGSNAMTPNGQMYFPAAYCKPDFSMERDRYKVWFIHEMTHVWQYQLGYGVLRCGVLIAIKGGYWAGSGQRLGRAYRYDAVADAGKPMAAFNMEQQGELISHYFDARYLHGDGTAARATHIKHMDFYMSALANFLDDPADASLLPNTTRIKSGARIL